MDDFYENPDEIRTLALSLNFIRRDNASYPGSEAVDLSHDWGQIMERIKSLVPLEKIKSIGYPEYPQGKFHLAYNSNIVHCRVGVHVDIAQWSAVIYLSKNPDPLGGTTWYQHIPTEQFSDTKEFLDFCYQDLPEKSPDIIRNRIYDISNNFSH